MRLSSIELRDFRSYHAAEAHLGPGLTVVHGRNGAGKSNLLEAICFGCTARSPRTRNDRELIRFGAAAARVSLRLLDDRGTEHVLAVGFGAMDGESSLQRRIRFDGAPVERPGSIPDRPLVVVFVPDRLELINGGPAVRRDHADPPRSTTSGLPCGLPGHLIDPSTRGRWHSATRSSLDCGPDRGRTRRCGAGASSLLRTPWCSPVIAPRRSKRCLREFLLSSN